MCCLFGLVDTKHRPSAREKSQMLSILGTACEVRGVDATGYAYNSCGNLTIRKEAVRARNMVFSIPQDAHVIMGHTRMTTQGSASHRRNNHPFPGILPKNRFALAHNGVLTNDNQLRLSENLPKTKIETDSYVAVQLIEKEQRLDFGSLRKMAEAVHGTFAFTILDRKNNLYFVKGNNPLCLYYFRREGVYLYASTGAILNTALEAMGWKCLPHEEIEIEEGEIVKISPKGNITRDRFQPPASAYRYDPYYDGLWDIWEPAVQDTPTGYRKYLLDYAALLDVPQRELTWLQQAGLPDFELEECVYDSHYRRLCLLETGYYDELEDYENGYESDRLAALPWAKA